MKTLNLF